MMCDIPPTTFISTQFDDSAGNSIEDIAKTMFSFNIKDEYRIGHSDIIVVLQ